MPIIASVQPPDVTGVEVSEEIDRRPRITTVSIPSAGVTGGRPEMQAGLALSKIVLAIVSGTILIFGAYLIAVDVIHRFTLAEAYRRVYSQVENGGEIVNPIGVQPFVTRLRAETGKPVSANKDEVEAVRDFARNIYRARLVSDDQRVAVEKCAGDLKPDQVSACADSIEIALKASNSVSPNLDKVRALTEFTKSIDESQKSFHGFWLQVAQLILLNLLLPLLTGLFGYIFGTTQAPSQSRENNV